VADEPRTVLVSALKISAECRRMGELAHHTAWPPSAYTRLRPSLRSYREAFAGWVMSRAGSLMMPASRC
jgi:hypothetical protein